MELGKRSGGCGSRYPPAEDRPELKCLHFNGEDRQAKSMVFDWYTQLPGAKS